MFAGASYDDGKLTRLHEAFELLDKFLDNQIWVAGSKMTIADLTLASSVSTAEVYRLFLLLNIYAERLKY
jgi:glutathione S-transferase